MEYNSEAGEVEAFEFTGRASEWFGIWIVNLLLSIVTLGIYSAWAKVRRKKYFYQNTHIAGRNFDYHATGVQVLFGRLIVVAWVVVYWIAGTIPLLAISMLCFALALLPWLVVRALKFNAGVTSWANVRFKFDGEWGGAFRTFVIYPFLAAFTLFLASPAVARVRHRFVINGHSLGKAPFEFSAPVWPFYRALLVPVLWVAVAAVPLLVVLDNFFMSFDEFMAYPERRVSSTTFIAAVYGFLLFGLLPAALIYGAAIRNTLINGITLDGRHRMASDVAPLRLVWIELSNALVVVLSLGFLMPWAHVRRMRYLCEHTAVLPGGSLDDFASEIVPRGSAVGDAFTDFQGIDIGAWA